MKKLKKILLVIIMILTLIPFISVKASTFDDYFNVTNEDSDTGEYNHSRFVVGRDIKSKSTVSGVSLVAGYDLDIESNSEYGLFAGNTINIKGNIENDLFTAGNKIVIDEDTAIGRDVFIAASRVIIDANIKGNIFIAASDVQINGDIAGNLYVSSSKVKFDDVTVSGDVTLSVNNIEFVDEVTINGELKYNDNANFNGKKNASISELSEYKISNVNKITLADRIISKMMTILSTIVLAFMINLIFPKIYKKLSKDIDSSKVLKNISLGLCTMIIVPIISIIVLLTAVGIKLGLLMIGLYAICITLASLTATVVIGNNILMRILKSKDNSYLSILLGIVTVSIVSLMPLFGVIINILLMLYGLGIIVETIKNNR